MTDGLKDKHREVILSILRANEKVERVVLFGSRATATHTVSSDIDLALFGKQLTLADIARLAREIEKTSVPQKVDLLWTETVKNPALRREMEQHGVEWYRRDWSMVAEWKETTLGEVATLQRGIDLPDQKRKNGKVPILGSFGITGYHDEARVKAPGVTVGRSGASFGVVNFSAIDFWPLNTALYVKDFHGNNEKFVYYFLKAFDFKSYNSGSAQPSLNRNFVHPVPVIIPPLSTQRAIAHILGTLDDKIELNRRMNQTLEAMARAVFKSWFVDFDPVRAKMEGREPEGMDAQTAALFPDRLVDSELGEVPEGWEVGRVGDIVDFAYGKALKNENRIQGDYPVYGSNGIIGWHNEPLVNGPGIVVGRKGNPGIVTWANSDFFPIDTTFYVVAKGSIQSMHFLFFVLGLLDLPSLGADSAVPGLNRNMAYQSELVVPPKTLVGAFNRLVIPIFKNAEANISESRTLAALRDALLPQLLSGEVRVETR